MHQQRGTTSSNIKSGFTLASISPQIWLCSFGLFRFLQSFLQPHPVYRLILPQSSLILYFHATPLPTSQYIHSRSCFPYITRHPPGCTSIKSIIISIQSEVMANIVTAAASAWRKTKFCPYQINSCSSIVRHVLST